MIRTILLVFGTRPEAIKMLPVAEALSREPGLRVQICVTAQHRQMLDQVLDLFAVRPDYDLDLMRNAQSLTQVTTGVLTGLAEVIEKVKPDRILVHGDTTTSMAASIAAFYAKVPVGHVEAGLRSDDPLQPWPEEINRRIADVICDLYFAPTSCSRANLLRENVQKNKIFVTGNTVIDALRTVLSRIRERPEIHRELERRFSFLDPTRKLLLVTGHRRENFGSPFRNLCEAIRNLALRYPIEVVYPVHLNPNVQSAVREVLADCRGVHLLDPLDYLPFVYLLQRSHVVLTDSGGLQEEAPSLGKPVFVMRNVTERPEAVEAGTVRLVGTDRERIFAEVGRVLGDASAYETMSRAINPYGDGRASERIAAVLSNREMSEFTP